MNHSPTQQSSLSSTTEVAAPLPRVASASTAAAVATTTAASTVAASHPLSSLASADNNHTGNEHRGSLGPVRHATSVESREMMNASSNTRKSLLKDKLAFDLEQPWQRNLLRELENIERAGMEKHARPRADTILLGRSEEGGDYLVEYDDFDGDDITVTTEASAGLPKRSQVIHRTGPMQHHPAHNALFQDEEEEEDAGAAHPESTPPTLEKARRKPGVMGTTPPPKRPTEIKIRTQQQHHHHEDRRELNISTLPREPSSAREASLARHFENPDPHLASRIARASAVWDETALMGNYWQAVTTRASNKQQQAQLTEQQQALDEDAAFVNNAYDYAGSCMCLGYNPLEFFLPLARPQPLNRWKKRRMSSLAYPAGRQSMLQVVEENPVAAVTIFEDETVASSITSLGSDLRAHA